MAHSPAYLTQIRESEQWIKELERLIDDYLRCYYRPGTSNTIDLDRPDNPLNPHAWEYVKNQLAKLYGAVGWKVTIRDDQELYTFTVVLTES